MDIEEGVATIAEGLGLKSEEADPPAEQPPEAPPVEEQPPVEGEQPPAEEQQAEAPPRPAPKSWAKETHELWAKLDPKAQDQIELREKQILEGLEQYKQFNETGRRFNDIFTPYIPLLRSQGIEPPKAVEALMNAHFKLSTLQGQAKIDYFGQIAQTYGIDFAALTGKQPQPEDPRVKALEEKLAKLEGGMTQAQQQAFEQAKAKVTNDVNAFADAKDDKGNKLHPYFDEVADDVIVYLNAGAELKDAYEKAVYANPVTRAKEMARLQKEAEANLREKSKQEAKDALKAKGANVRSRDTKRSPTEPLGKMEDTLKETFREINSRAH